MDIDSPEWLCCETVAAARFLKLIVVEETANVDLYLVQ